MEHDDRAPVATFFVAAPFAAGATVTLGDGAAHHARVKRLEMGDVVRLTDGAGGRASGVITGIRRGALDLAIERTSTTPAQPPIHLRVPIGDRDRMLWLAEKAAELGIASWQAVRFRRSTSVSPRGEGQTFAEKTRARMIAALEQSGGAWLPSILPDAELACVDVEPGATRLVLDAHGAPALSIDAGAGVPVILFGPEGGIEASELAQLVAAGWRRTRLGGTTLRFETAGLAAVAVFRALGDARALAAPVPT